MRNTRACVAARVNRRGARASKRKQPRDIDAPLLRKGVSAAWPLPEAVVQSAARQVRVAACGGARRRHQAGLPFARRLAVDGVSEQARPASVNAPSV